MSRKPAEQDTRFAETGITFDDVLLLPGRSDVLPTEVDTSTQFGLFIFQMCTERNLQRTGKTLRLEYERQGKHGKPFRFLDETGVCG